MFYNSSEVPGANPKCPTVPSSPGAHTRSVMLRTEIYALKYKHQQVRLAATSFLLIPAHIHCSCQKDAN
jgi:hypothetical protein